MYIINLHDYIQLYKYDAGSTTSFVRPPAAAGMSASTSRTASIATGTSSTASGGGGSGGRTSGSTSSSTVTRASRRHDSTEKYLAQKPLGVLGSRSSCLCQPRAVGLPAGGDVCDDDGIHLLCPRRRTKGDNGGGCLPSAGALTCGFVLPSRTLLKNDQHEVVCEWAVRMSEVDSSSQRTRRQRAGAACRSCSLYLSFIYYTFLCKTMRKMRSSQYADLLRIRSM